MILGLSPFQYALGGLTIIAWLLITGHAQFCRIGKAACGGCADKRVSKQIVVLGGSAGFTFGWLYFFLASQVDSSCHSLLMTYGYMRFGLSVFNALTYIVQIHNSRLRDLPLKAHLDGCGFTTAWSPFWPLYWVGKIPVLSWPIGKVRDLLTIVDWLSSLPGVIIISFITKLLFGKWTIPMLTRVDYR